MKVTNIIILSTLIISIPAFAGIEDLFDSKIEKAKKQGEAKPEPQKEEPKSAEPAPTPSTKVDIFEQAQTSSKIEILEQITAKSNELAELLEAMAEMKKFIRPLPDNDNVRWFGNKELPKWTEDDYAYGLFYGFVNITSLDEEKGIVTGTLKKGLLGSVGNLGSIFGKKKKPETPYSVTFNIPDNTPLYSFQVGKEFSIYENDYVCIDHVDHVNKTVSCTAFYLTIDGKKYSLPEQYKIKDALNNGELRAKKLKIEIANLQAKVK